jgi:hypothetical protein
MAENGHSNVQAAGGTIVYCIDNDKIKQDIYKIEALTVGTNILKIGIFAIISPAGHIFLKYLSGGMILTIHWVKIMKTNAS